MKIWYQSSSAYGFEPIWDEYGNTIKQQCAAVLHPDTELHVCGIPVMVRDIENWRGLQYLQNLQVIDNMRRAQEQGYDAFVIGCTLDVALFEGRSLLDIPVVGISETAYHAAMTLGRKFAIVTSSPAFCEVYGEQVVRYGVESRHLPHPYIVEASEEEIACALTEPAALMEKFIAVATQAIKDGACVIIPAPAFLSTLAHRAGVHEILGAPILDTIALVAKAAEAQVPLWRNGLRPCRRIGAFAQPDLGWANPAFARLREIPIP